MALRGETRSPEWLVGDEQDHQHAGRQQHYPNGAQYPPDGHRRKATPETDLDTVRSRPGDCPALQQPNCSCRVPLFGLGKNRGWKLSYSAVTGRSALGSGASYVDFAALGAMILPSEPDSGVESR